MSDLGWIAFGTVVAIVVMIGGAMWAAEASCHRKAGIMGLESRWGIIEECMVKHKGQWLPLGAVRSVTD